MNTPSSRVYLDHNATSPLRPSARTAMARLVDVDFGNPASLDEPDMVRAIHADYIAAGADVITTNTFRASRVWLRTRGLADQIPALNRRSVELAIEARKQAGAVATVAVAGSISTANTTEATSVEEGYEAYLEQARLLAAAGADLLILEMLKDVPQAYAALAAAKQAGLPVWAGFSCRTTDNGGTELLATEPGQSFADALHEIGPLEVDAATIMHTKLEDAGAALAVLQAHWHGPIGAYPHAGTWLRPEWEFDASLRPESLTANALRWKSDGSRIFGACCGMGVDYIAALHDRVRGAG